MDDPRWERGAGIGACREWGGGRHGDGRPCKERENGRKGGFGVWPRGRRVDAPSRRWKLGLIERVGKGRGDALEQSPPAKIMIDVDLGRA